MAGTEPGSDGMIALGGGRYASAVVVSKERTRDPRYGWAGVLLTKQHLVWRCPHANHGRDAAITCALRHAHSLRTPSTGIARPPRDAPGSVGEHGTVVGFDPEPWEARVPAPNGRCHYCKELTADLVRVHRTPMSRRGLDHPANIVLACKRCSRLKGSRTEQEFLDFLAVGAPQKHSRMRKPSKFLVSFLVLTLVGGLAIGLCLAALVPGIRQIAVSHKYTAKNVTLGELSQQTVVYDAAGTELARLGYKEGTRQPVEFDDVPRILRQAVIATEDQSFWTNPGFDIGGSARALFKNLGSGRIEQGGSTITQQLVKIRFLNNNRDFRRKVREMVLAYRLTEKYTKRQILEQYLNTVYFGQGAYGVKSAAKQFFNKDNLADINIGEAALLAGVIRSPSADNPWDYPERATQRRAQVLDQMADQGYITEEEAALVDATPLGVQPTKRSLDLRPTDAWVLRAQTVLMNDPRLGSTFEQREKKVLQGGLKIYTTKDPVLQAEAEEVVRATMANGPPRPAAPGFDAALVAIEPRTGYVRAMVDSRGYSASQFNLATDGGGEQVGSSFKVATLATLLANGYSPNDLVDGSSGCKLPSHPLDPSIANAERGGGRMTLQNATTGSVNCAFVRASGSVGLDKVAEMATKLGMRPKVDGRQAFEDWDTPTLTLGVVSVTPVEMATIAATIASGGEHHNPSYVWKVEDALGRVIFDETQRPGERVLEPEVAACVAQVLHGPLYDRRGTAYGKAPLGHDAFGKTGTNDRKISSAFLGATPELAAFVWHGDAENPIEPPSGGQAGFGGELPVSIWNTFINAALEDTTASAFPAPGPGCDAPGELMNPAGGRTPVPTTTPRAPDVVAPRVPTAPTDAGGIPPPDSIPQPPGVASTQPSSPQESIPQTRFPNR